MVELANQGRERAAARLAGASATGLPGLIIEAQQQFGSD